MSAKVETGRETMVGVRTTDSKGNVRKLDAESTKTAEFDLALKLTEHDSTIFAGFQTEWGAIDEIDLTLYAGAGMGSSWATINYKGRRFAISAPQLVEAFLAAVDPDA
jgi:hypothetical protein